MKHPRPRLRTTLLLLGSCFAPMAWGHGAEAEVIEEVPAEIVRFGYTAGQAMDGARVRVLLPDSRQVFQVGRSDAQGHFAFVPDRPGRWIVEADDERGHKLEVAVAVGAAASAEPRTPERIAIPPHLLLWALIVSVLANAGLLSALIGAKKRTP
ncbi:hypothetical protein [Algiphilus sp.]|uniref:hypothetical protein n=2 Tax=Algiphilus sp. TaxID=1872431 RepID=UPI0032EEAE3B